jgi:hypothetical protein
MSLTGGYLNDLYVYDPISLTWTDLVLPTTSAYPASRLWMGFAAVGEMLYVHGGYSANGTPIPCSEHPDF